MPDAHPLGSWPALVARLDDAGYPQRWSQTADCMAGLTSVGQLRAWTAPGDPQRTDAVLGALVRLAAARGGADTEAALVLLHLLSPGAQRFAARIRHLTPDPMALVLGELALQIRRFPTGRRTRAFAANLLLDTRLAVWRELDPYRTDRPGHPAELILDLSTEDALPRWHHLRSDTLLPGPGDDELDLVDLLLWARRSGAVDPTDLAVLLETEFLREVSGAGAQQQVADRHGVTVRTVQRRRHRALTALQACRGHYLAAA